MGTTWYYCTNAQKEIDDPKNRNGNLFLQPKTSVLLGYPIAVPCDLDEPDDINAFTSGLGVVNVIAWKGKNEFEKV